MKIARFVGVAAIALAATACESSRFGNNQASGGLIGGVAGGVAGNVATGGSTTGTIVGAALGVLIGSEIGRQLDEQDQQRAHAAAQNSFATGRTTRWSNQGTGHYGTVDPTPTYTNPSGNTCRSFTHTMWVDGRNEAVKGTACRGRDGSWQMVS
jgi:surface antigen